VELSIFQVILMYLALGAIVGLAFHLKMQQAIRQCQTDQLPPCTKKQRAARDAVEMYSVPEALVPVVATVQLAVSMVLWPVVLAALTAWTLHPCAAECAPRTPNTDQEVP